MTYHNITHKNVSSGELVRIMVLGHPTVTFKGSHKKWRVHRIHETGEWIDGVEWVELILGTEETPVKRRSLPRHLAERWMADDIRIVDTSWIEKETSD